MLDRGHLEDHGKKLGDALEIELVSCIGIGTCSHPLGGGTKGFDHPIVPHLNHKYELVYIDALPLTWTAAQAEYLAIRLSDGEGER